MYFHHAHTFFLSLFLMIIKTMLQALSMEELEHAARSSYRYFQFVGGFVNKDPSTTTTTTLSQTTIDKLRWKYAQCMARRHWVAEKGQTQKAIAKLKATLHHRRTIRIDDIRTCFDVAHTPHDTDFAQETRRRITNYLGTTGRMFVRGHDQCQRAVFHFIVQNAPDPSTLPESNAPQACLDAHYYILEKAFACSERKSRRVNQKKKNDTHNDDDLDDEDDTSCQEMVIVTVDFENFQKWHAPPTSVISEMLEMLKYHYPERLHRVYFLGAPLLFRALWSLMKPFVDPITKQKFVFCTGTMEERTAIFENAGLPANQAMLYQRPMDGELIKPVDMQRFYELPYDVAYDELDDH